MKRTYTALSLAIMLMIGIYFAAAPSAACCGDGAVAAQGAITAGTSVSSAISSATGTLVQNLQQINDTITNGFGKLYAEQNKQTASEKTMQEGVVQAQTQIYLEGKRAEAEVAMKVSPRACYELQAADAVAKADSSFQGTVLSINKAASDRTLYTPNSAAAVDNIFRTHASRYCSAQDAKLGRCSSPVAADLQNADIRADNLLSRDVLSTQQSDGADAFIQNVLNPYPTQMLPKGWERTAAGQAFIAGQYVEQGRNSVAANSFAHMKASRVVQPGLGTAAGLDQADISMRQLIRSQADGRFLSAPWYKMVAGFSQENLLRELNKQMAFSTWMDYQRLEQNERIEAILATDLATNAKRDSEERLTRAREAAAKAK